jgi:asparagine synthase (glutamine-hydrolysing)
MCGIAGKAVAGGSVAPELIDRMCAVIRHRGPDSHGVHCDAGVGLGIQRLRIIDLDTGDQPIFNEDRSVAVILNGEIYNYRELRDELVEAGHRFRTRSDTEVIAHLYEDEGEGCVRRLRGMFAFAVWDARERRLLLARDRVGKKPLFYTQRGNAIWFASEAKSILQDPEIPRAVNLEAIDAYLATQYVPHPQSAFAGLHKLPPAHTLTWHEGHQRIQRYWRLSYETKLVGARDEDLQELMRAELMEATRLRMRSDVPLGAFLSGGVDSSAVVAAMAQQSEGRVKTFSIGFDVEEFDETAYAEEVARLFDTDHHSFRVEPKAMDVLPSLVWHYGEPFADSSAIPSMYLAELARGHVTVALNGDGGDESMAGYPRYAGNALAERLRGVPAPLLRAGVAALDRVAGSREPSQAVRRVRRLLDSAPLPPWERYAAWVATFDEAERDALYSDELRSSLVERPAAKLIRESYISSDADNVIERLLDVDLQSFLPGGLLVKMDIATMAHSLEVRSPLLDHRFMEVVASMPASAKARGRRTKVAFKDALRPWLPDHILDRTKMGFGVPLAQWFRGDLRELPGEVLLDPRSLDRGYFRPDAVRRLIEDHHERRRDNSQKLWSLLQLELWLRTYIDPPVAPSAPVALDAVAGAGAPIPRTPAVG